MIVGRARTFLLALACVAAVSAGGAPAASPVHPRPADAPDPAGPGRRTAIVAAAVPASQPTLRVTAIRVGRARAAGGHDVTAVPLEDYVARVLAGEAAPRSAAAALEALAIAVRTFAIANLGRHRGDGFDLCDQTHCQVMATATPATRQAAAATVGRILTYRDQPASIFYTACCGGRSEVPSDVWPRGQDQPFLKRHKDRACGRMPEWTSEIDGADLLRALNAAGLRGDNIRNVRVGRRSDSGRAALVKVEGLDPEEISGDDLRAAVGRALGWQIIKSTAFEVKRISSGFRFTGRGFGHGVGMCVVGAGRMAAEGRNAAEILEEYFPGTTIAPLAVAEPTDPQPSSPVQEDAVLPRPTAPAPPPARAIPRPAPFPTPSAPRLDPPPAATPPAAAPPRTADAVRLDVVLPAGGAADSGTVRKMARAALTDISRRAGVPLPSAVTIVFHATIESYAAQTKLPWWTAAATRDNRIDLLPLPLLEERRILERTIRHEIAHVLAAPSLAGRPVWVKEGAATYLSGERVEPPVSPTRAGRVACPTDDELLTSQSPASLHDAYARAAACYAAQIAAGRRWDQVGATR